MKNTIRVGALASMMAVACSSALAINVNLGTLGATDTTFGNTFYKADASFTDYYTFSIGNPGTVTGTTNDGKGILNAIFSFDKDVTLTSLILGNTSFSALYGADLTISPFGQTNTFGFNGLAAGTYKLAVSGFVTPGDNKSASYTGTIRTTASVASPAPEPADLALTVMGLAGVGLMLRRSRKAA